MNTNVKGDFQIWISVPLNMPLNLVHLEKTYSKLTAKTRGVLRMLSKIYDGVFLRG